MWCVAEKLAGWGSRLSPMKRLAVLLVVVLAGCTSPQTLESRPSLTPRVHTYGYYVTGTASGADVTYTTGSGTSQASVDLPLMNKSGKQGIQMVGDAAPDFLYISAQNSGESGEVMCQITVDGVVVAQNTASGAFMIATCQASK